MQQLSIKKHSFKEGTLQPQQDALNNKEHKNSQQGRLALEPTELAQITKLNQSQVIQLKSRRELSTSSQRRETAVC